MNKTSFFSAVFLSLTLSFACQAEAPKDTAPEANKVEAPSVIKGLTDKKPEDAACGTYCLNSISIGGNCLYFCGGCPGTVQC